jgi:hypothetical protein
MPTRHPRQIVTLTPERAALLNQIATLEGRRPDLGGLVEEGARVRIARVRGSAEVTTAATRRLAARVLDRTLGQDPDAADRLKRIGSEI